MFQQRTPGSSPGKMTGMMSPTQDRRLPTIYGGTTSITESREVLAEARNPHMQTGSVTSIPVYREQYCLCTPTTRLEKRLVIVVIALVLLLLVLLVGISILADRENDRSLKNIVQALTPNF